ncbi:MAG: 3-dehydroquinate dehydratase [Bacteroidota bacterium]|nr:3-dehydroquinate dehydratase [Bacteroidota bacterium]MDX5431683.1 3-dehydroquinate dehydratase [Bacteroidota bacterium]MDX5470398.1 3-dehydroquinate dehydratase [Bacteroidota bacterium]
MKRVGIINGPNLNLLGKREPDIYGSETFESFLEKLKQDFPEMEIRYYQSNVEGELINKLHEWGFTHDGLLLNAGGYTHTSVALGDAVASIDAPVIEIHLSNILKREDFRQVDQISRAAKGVIMGFGMESYRLGLLALNL